MRGLPAGVWFLCFVSLLTDVASDAVYPVLPLFLSTVLHASMTSIGFIEGIAETTASLLKLFSGSWADRLGRSRGLVFVGYFLSSLAKPVMALATAWPHVLMTRFLDRIGKGIRSAPRDAWLARLAPAGRTADVFGYHRGMDHLGAVLGPLLASAFFLFRPDDYRTLFLLTLIPGLLACVFVLMTPEVPVAPIEPKKRWDFSGWHLFPRPLKKYLGLVLLFALGNSSDAFLLLLLKEKGIALAWIPVLWAGLHVVKVLMSFASGSLVRTLGLRRMLLTGWAIFALTYLGLGQVESKPLLILLFLVYGGFAGLTEGPERALVAALAPSSARGTAFGLYAMMTGIAALPASVWFGAVWQARGAYHAFTLSSGIAVVCFLVLRFGFKREELSL